ALSIGAHRVAGVSCRITGVYDRGFENQFGSSQSKRWCQHHINSHDSPYGEISNFFSVCTPARIHATAVRDLPLSVAIRKRPDINLGNTRFIREVNDKATVWRKLAETFVVRTLQERHSLPLARHRQVPDVVSSLGIRVREQKKSSIL